MEGIDLSDNSIHILSAKGKDDQGDFKAFSGLTTTDTWQDKYFVQDPAPGSMKVKVPRKDIVFWKGRDKIMNSNQFIMFLSKLSKYIKKFE